MEGDTYIKMRITPELLQQLFTRDERGNKLVLSLSEPDAAGFCDAAVTVDYTDNLLAKPRELPSTKWQQECFDRLAGIAISHPDEMTRLDACGCAEHLRSLFELPRD